MLRKLKIPLFCMMFFGASYYPVSIIGLDATAKANEVSDSEDNPGHGHSHKKREKHKCGERHHGEHERKLMHLTECAWKELLKEKIKANLEAKEGKRLDRVADVLVDAMIEKYKKMKECRKEEDDLKKKLEEAFAAE
ncbi:MAG: hypothetical protein ACUBOA_05015 [Candidatus Loosdrechtia sp.]|uniref:hypothetical protein n=1 Tax=Candidatus Loosdrechtia sp. TaxID=3101272 RepID=UPI003A64D30B|nr:MAG: hypothetical protein QY305_14200 [Candidatus Jettenia sp. AMX2]